MDRSQEKWFLILLQVLLGLATFSLLIPGVNGLPQDTKKGLLESFSDDKVPMYDDMGMRIRNKAEKNVKLDIKNEDPFKPTTGHVPGGLPMISDSAFSLTILIYVSVAFLLVFFLFCWKTQGGSGNSAEDLKNQCVLMTNAAAPEMPQIIPPTPTGEQSKLIQNQA